MRSLLLVLILFSSHAAFPQAGDAPDPDWQAEIDLFNRFMASGDPSGAYPHAQKSLAIAQAKRLGPRFVAGSDAALADALHNLGRYAEAEPLHREGLRLRESVLPPTHYRVLQSVNGLAHTLYAEKKFDEAEPLFLRSIAGFDAIPERDGPQECALGSARAELGRIRFYRQDYVQAEGLFKLAVASWEQVGPGCGELHELFESLGMLYQAQGHPEKQVAVYRHAIAEFEAAEALDDPHYPGYLTLLGEAYLRQKQYQAAEQPLHRAVGLLEQMPQGRKALFERALADYRDLLTATGRDQEARTTQARLDALQQATADSGPTPSAQWQAQVAIAQKAEQEQRFAAAEEAYRASVAAAGKLPPSDTRFVMTYLTLANFLDGRQRPSDALSTLIEGVHAVQSADAFAPMASQLFINLANHQLLASDVAGAEATLDRALAYRARWNQPDDAIELSSLSGVRRQRGKAKDAIALAARALRAAEAQVGPDAFPIAMFAETLGLAYEADQQYAAAEQQYTRMLALEEKQFGPNHAALSGPLLHLAAVYRSEGKHAEADQAEARRQHLGK